MNNRVSTLIAIFGAIALTITAAPADARGGKGGGSHSSKSATGSTAGNNSKEHSVSGYTKKDGTYVAPHHSTNPNQSKRDNYSSKGNVNPHTGKPGSKDPDKP